MDSEDTVKSKINIDKNILDLFWKLCEKNVNIRVNACADILQVIWKKQQELEKENELCTEVQYCIERLVKGLASPRDAARLGYTLLLTEVLKNIKVVQIEEVLELIKKHLTITGKQDKRDLVFGQLFAYTAIVRSGRLPNHTYLSYVILSLYELYHGKNYILNATYKIVLDILSQVSNDNFKDIWAHLKKKLPSDWETSSADSLWLLLLYIRLFPDAITAKFLKNRWGTDDLFSPENLNNMKKLIKQTTSSLPILHPFCIEFLLLSKQRRDFSEIWNSVVDENLFDHEQTEKTFVGFEMIKAALQDAPTKKILKIVMSSKFRVVFSKSFLNIRSPMNRAAVCMADFLGNFVKNCDDPEMQIIILKTFLQPPGTVVLDQVLKKKEVSLIIQNLLPDAIKALCDILVALLLRNKSTVDNSKEVNNMKRCQAAQQIANLVAHPVMLADVDWRMDIIKLLFLNSFFFVKEATSEVLHCDKISEPLSDTLRDACMTAFFKSVNSLHIRTEKHHSSLSSFLELLLLLTEYAENLMGATENVEPRFSIKKVQDAWKHLKTIVHKLNKQSKKDGLVNESNAFRALFLQLGFHLFQDPDSIPEVLEELQLCCKKSLKSRKKEVANKEDEESEPPWIGVVVDILLSLLSKSSKHLRSLVTYVFPLFSPFIDENALQQILDVINPQSGDENMVLDESDGEDGQEVEFGSGSSSDESEEEINNQPVDEQFKKKIQEALGPAADNSDAESVVLSDSEMFKLDNALSEAFKSRTKSGHTQMKSEEKTLLHFRMRCFDLILSYLKSEPPMYLVLKCIEPVLAAYEFGHHSKHQGPLLHKAVTVLQFITKMRKFQNHDDVSKSELKRLLEILIPKCHKEINISISQKLSSLCVFIVLCYRKLEAAASDKKKAKTSFYLKAYLSALDTFVSSGSSHMLPNFFTHLMEACPELAWNFIEPCKNHAFNNNIRLFKRTQCLGLLCESLKYSKSQKEIPHDDWVQLANDVLPLAIEVLKNAFENSDLKPVYSTEILNVIHTLYSIVKEKTGQSVLEKHSNLLPLLMNENKDKIKKLGKKGKSLKHKIVICLGGNVNQSKKSKVETEENEKEEKPDDKRKFEELSEETEVHANGDLSSQAKKKLKKKKKKSLKMTDNNIDGLSDENN